MISKSNKGFTLVELLFVISILSFLSSIVFASLTVTNKKTEIADGEEFESNLDATLTSYAVGIWNFNEGPGNITTADSSGFGNNLSGISSSMWSNETVNNQGYSLVFNGQEISLSPFNNQPMGSNPITVAAWVRPAISSGIGTIACVGVDSGSPTAYGIYQNNGKFSASYASANGEVDSVSAPQANTWYFVAGVEDGSTNSIYIDGKLENKINYSSGNLEKGEIKIGAWCDSGGNFFDGNIERVRVFSSGLTADAINNIYLAERDNFLREN